MFVWAAKVFSTMNQQNVECDDEKKGRKNDVVKVSRSSRCCKRGGRNRQQANKIEQSHHITTVLTFFSAMILLPSGSVDISSHSNGVRGYIPPHDSHV
jgi:hypothetical protein